MAGIVSTENANFYVADFLGVACQPSSHLAIAIDSFAFVLGFFAIYWTIILVAAAKGIELIWIGYCVWQLVLAYQLVGHSQRCFNDEHLAWFHIDGPNGRELSYIATDSLFFVGSAVFLGAMFWLIVRVGKRGG
jgi:hypothetical protein